jgi:hypothetical protein
LFLKTETIRLRTEMFKLLNLNKTVVQGQGTPATRGFVRRAYEDAGMNVPRLFWEPWEF